MTLSFIYARSLNRCIGKNGQIPWRLPDEFQHFKKITMGKPIIMGRRTYEDHESALPGRLNIVVTRQPDYPATEGVEVCSSLEAALERARRESDEVFIVGGVDPFVAAFAAVDHVYETVVHAEIEGGDTFLPEFDFSGFECKKLWEHAADARHAFAFTAYRYDRRRRVSEFVVSRPIPRFLVREPVGSEHEVDVVPGLRHDTVQSFDMIVSGATAAELHTVVMANAPPLSAHDRRVIAQALAATRRPVLAFLVESAEGTAKAESSSVADPRAMAAAVAVLCASSRATEDQPLSISVDEGSWRVSLGSDGKNWQCRVE